MRRTVYFIFSLFLIVGMILSLERRAHAYVDPGSSLVLYQGASSLVLGTIYYFRKRIKALMYKFRPSRKTPDGQA